MPEETALKVEEPVNPATLAEPKKEEPHEDPTTISEYLESLLVTVLLALFGTSFVVQAFKIPSASMEGTLLIGDHLLVNKFIFGGTGAWYEKILPYRDLERGDIIVFKYPYAVHDSSVFADPFNYSFPPARGQMMSPNAIPEWRPEIRKYVQGDEIVVPPKKYFAMGDNRDH